MIIENVSYQASRGTRREFLARSGAGFGALALSALMRSPARAGLTLKPPAVDPLNPFAPRLPHFAPTAKSVIFLFMVGGPRSEEHTSELQSLTNLVCRLLL